MLLVGGWLAPEEARAGCTWGGPGHPDPTRPTAHFALLDLAGHGSGAEMIPQPGPSTPPSPCASGRCAPAPAIPPASSPPVPSRAELWGCLPPADPVADPGSDACPSDDDCPRPTRRGLSIDRPPRSPSSSQVA
jgi:hypothetical protein